MCSIYLNLLELILLILWWQIPNDDIKPVFWSIRAVSLHHPTSRNPNDPFSALLLMKTNFWAPRAMRRTKKRAGNWLDAFHLIIANNRQSEVRFLRRNRHPREREMALTALQDLVKWYKFPPSIWLVDNHNFYSRQSKQRQSESKKGKAT